MATPIVSGAVALMKQAHPEWTPEQIKYALKNTAKNIGDDPRIYGHGRVDILSAVSLDNAPHIAKLSSINLETDMTLKISGFIETGYFENYSLYYKAIDSDECYKECYKAIDSDEWLLINHFYSLPSSDLLYEGVLDFADGEYIIKLVVNYQGEEVKDYAYLTTDRIEINEPYNGDVFKPGIYLSINGSIYLKENEYYIIKISGPNGYLGDVVNLMNNGERGIKNDVIAWLDTSTITELGNYRLEIFVWRREIPRDILVAEDNIQIYLDPKLKEGWPKYFNNAEFNGRNFASPMNLVYHDVNNDGKIELIFVRSYLRAGHFDNYTSPEPHKLFILDENGDNLPGFPVNLSDNLCSISSGYVSIGDLNNDDNNEILLYANACEEPYSQVFAYNLSGHILGGFPINVIRNITYNPRGYSPREITGSLVLFDIDKDNYSEIIAYSVGRNIMNETEIASTPDMVYVWDSRGNLKTGWPIELQITNSIIPFGKIVQPVIGNLDGDEESELVIITEDGNSSVNRIVKMYILNHDGSFMSEPIVIHQGLGPYDTLWTIGPHSKVSPIIGDIDNDGSQEIVVYVDSLGLYVFENNGSLSEGWPNLDVGFYSMRMQPILVDLDNDSYLEIILGAIYNKESNFFDLYAFKYDGSLVWKQNYSFRPADFLTQGSLISGDLDGDNKPEILFGNDDKIRAIKNDGQEFPGFPLQAEYETFSVPIIIDFDNDGNTEIIASSENNYDFINRIVKKRGSLYVWELNNSYNYSLFWPQFQHDAQHTGCYDCEKKAVCGISNIADCTIPENVVQCRDAFNNGQVTATEFIGCISTFNVYIESNGGCVAMHGSYCVCKDIIGVECSDPLKLMQCKRNVEQGLSGLTEFLGCSQVCTLDNDCQEQLTYNGEKDLENSYENNGCTNPGNAVDENWDTRTEKRENGICVIYENYTWQDEYAYGIKLESKVHATARSMGIVRYSCYDYITQSYKGFYNETLSSVISTPKVAVLASCILENNPLLIKTELERTGGSSGRVEGGPAPVYLYENKIWYHPSG